MEDSSAVGINGSRQIFNQKFYDRKDDWNVENKMKTRFKKNDSEFVEWSKLRTM